MKTAKNNKKLAIIFAPLVIILLVLTYYQLLYKAPRADEGIVSLVYTFTGHHDIVQAVSFSPDGNLVASASVDSTVKLWNRETGEIMQSFNHPQGLTYMDYSDDGKYIVTSSYDGKTRLWNAGNGSLLKEFGGHTGTVWHVSVSHDARWMASSGDDAVINIWDVVSGNLVHSLKGHKRTVWSVKFSPDGKYLASASYDNAVKIWNVQDGHLIRTINGHTEAVVDVAYSHNGQILASTSDDKTIKLWNPANGQLLRTMTAPEHIQGAAFSPDDKRLMTSGRDKPMIGELVQNLFGDSEFNKGVSARLWDVETGKLLHTFSEQKNDVNDVACSRDGKWIATASADRTVCIWSVNK